jgi:dTDP-4-amino-4,6-dideoxygalactose transaminase
MSTHVRIPLNDLGRHNHALSNDLAHAIERVLGRGWYILGPELEAFESEFAAFCNTKHAVGVGNGTDALELALRALNLAPGSEVATVANAGMYSSAAIIAAGCTPVYVDVDLQTLTMSPAALALALTPRTAAVIVTHLYGRMALIEDLLAIAGDKQIPVIEDCAQAHGSERNGRKAGSWGALGCFSFYPTKNCGALGDAGAVVTNDGEFAARVQSLRQYGWQSKYQASLPGGRNSRMDELQAAVLRVKLSHIRDWNTRRRSIANYYTSVLSKCRVSPPPISPDESYVAHLYVLRSPNRDALRAALAARGIATDVHYPVPDYRQACMAAAGRSAPALEITEQCCREVVTLPCFPEMSDAEVEEVADAAAACASQSASGCAG